MFKFPESIDEILPYTRVYNANEGRWINIQGKRFPGFISCLVNNEQKANLIK